VGNGERKEGEGHYIYKGVKRRQVCVRTYFGQEGVGSDSFAEANMRCMSAGMFV
jgi:hypothetical protein